MNLLKRISNRYMRFRYQASLNKENRYLNHGTSWNLKIEIKGMNNHIEIGPDCSLRNVKIMISGNDHRLILKNNVRMKSGVLWLEGAGNLIEINRDTTIEGASIAALEVGSKVVIGEDCMFSDQIVIRNGDSHSIIDAGSGDRLNPQGDIIIRDHVWLGANVTVLKNVVIEENAIVGINSLVTRHVRANSIVAGSPAREVREHINWKRELIPMTDRSPS